MFSNRMYVCYLQLENKDATGTSKVAMYIRVHPPLYRQSNGRPIAIVSVVDNDLAIALMHAGKMDQMQAVKRWKDIMINHHFQVRLPHRPDRK